MYSLVNQTTIRGVILRQHWHMVCNTISVQDIAANEDVHTNYSRNYICHTDTSVAGAE
jgi:hypothetical protein